MDRRPPVDVWSPSAAAPSGQTTLPPPPYHPGVRRVQSAHAQQQSPGASAAFGGRAFVAANNALTLASAGEYGAEGARMIDSLRADKARLEVEIVRLKGLQLTCSAPAAAGGTSSAPAPLPAAAAASAPPTASLDAKVSECITSLAAYVEAISRFGQQQQQQRRMNQISSAFGGGGGGGASSSSAYVGGASSSSSSSSSAAGEPPAPTYRWEILTPALRALAETEGLMLAYKPISLFRGLHEAEEDDFHPRLLCAQQKREEQEGEYSSSEEFKRDVEEERRAAQERRVAMDTYKNRKALHTDSSVVIRALGQAGSLTALIAGHASGRFSSVPPTYRPTRSFTSLPQIAERRYASAAGGAGSRGGGERIGTTIMVTFEEGAGLLIGVNMNYERLFPGGGLGKIGDHEFVFIGPCIKLDAVRVMRWSPSYGEQMGGNRYGHTFA